LLDAFSPQVYFLFFFFSSVLLTANSEAELKKKINYALDYMTGWFSANGLVLNIEKTKVMKFTPSNRQNEIFQIMYQNRLLIGTNKTIFLGLELDKNINWKNHIQKILPKLSSACYLIRRMCPSCNINTLKMIHFAYFHSVMEFVIIFWGVSVESKIIFLQQKRIIRIMTGSPTRTTCKMLFQKLKILTLISQYILSLMRFLLSNLNIFTFNSSEHNINTRLRLKLHKPLVRLKMYQWSSCYNCINICNKLPDDLANLMLNKKRFLSQIKKISDRQALLYTGRILERSVLHNNNPT
jgi:hypothetical protein